MITARDALWSVALCAAMSLLLHCQPAWSAERFVERQANAGFAEAFAGYRTLDGSVIAPEGRGVQVDPLAPPVMHRRFEVTAERTSWNGREVELVVRYAIELGGEDPATREVHVRLAKRGASWVYTGFAVRGRGELAAPNDANPWVRALQPG